MMETAKRVLKTPRIEDPVHLEDPVQVQKRRQEEAQDIVREARQRAERILAETFETIRRERETLKRESEQVLADLESRKAEIHSELQMSADKRAQEKVESEVRPKIEKIAAEFEALFRKTEESLSGTLSENRNDLIDLALRVAEKVVGRIAAEDASLVERTVTKVLEAARDRQEMIIRVNPKDLEAVERFRIPLMERFDDLRKLKFEVDGRVDRGGAWVETPTGFIDGRIRSQIEETLSMVLPDAENPQTTKQGTTLLPDSGSPDAGAEMKTGE